MSKWLKWAIIIGIIFCLAGFVYFKTRQSLEAIWGISCDNQNFAPGEIVKLSDRLSIAYPDYGNIRERDLENQEAIKALKDKLDWALEYNLQLKEQISQGGGEIITQPSGDFKVVFSGETDAGKYEGEAGTVKGWVYHKLSQTFNPIHLQVYIDKTGKTSVSSTADWVDITVEKVIKEKPAWYKNLWLDANVGLIDLQDKTYVSGGLSAGYGKVGLGGGWINSGWYLNGILHFSFQ